MSAAFILGCFIYCITYPTMNPMDKPVRRMSIASFLTVSSYAAAILVQNERTALFMFGIYNFLVDAVLILMLDYVRRFTGIMERGRRERKYLSIASAVDGVMMLINTFVQFMFRVSPVYDSGGNRFHHVEEHHFGYLYHLALAYYMVIVIIMVLSRKIVRSPKIYKVKYAAILVVLFIVFFVHTLYMKLSLKFDYSVMLYAIIAFLVCYFSLVFIPSGLLESLLYFTINGMNDGIICMDIDGRCVYANTTARNYCGDHSSLDDASRQAVQWIKEHNIVEETEHEQWEDDKTVSGESKYYSISYQRIYDREMNYVGFFFFLHDRTDEVKKLEAERYRASHDVLTKIYNREDFYIRARQDIDAKPNHPFFIVCTDVKNFKIINDVFGVDAGDRLLQKLAQITRSLAGGKCAYGRLSGDRFALCLPTERFNEERILREYSAVSGFLDRLSDGTFKVHVHIGVYEVTDRSLRISVMCDRACLAIRSIKDSYENIVAYYDNHMRVRYMNEQKVIGEFDDALNQGQFCLNIQPQVATDGSVRGGEALVRWMHPKEGKIAPSMFVPILEDTGLICRLDMHIWELACQVLSRWKKMGFLSSYLSVNISLMDFHMIDVYSTITSLCSKYGIEHKCLHLEITETSIMDNPVVQLALLERFRSVGFVVEIDDFGSGYSSLKSLKDMNADVLKIDMEFLSNTGHQEKSKTIVKTVIGLAKELNMEVITEGVEDKEQVEYLTEYGCDIFQGFYFARPMEVKVFEEKYLGRRFIM